MEVSVNLRAGRKNLVMLTHVSLLQWIAFWAEGHYLKSFLRLLLLIDESLRMAHQSHDIR